ncbi:MerR family transcriptional regulator [Lancefieldella parvula]
MADSSFLTIGKVVKKLQTLYPDLSVSKVRYLQNEGLITPIRTAGGYRLYSQNDVKRLETILYLQKNRFMPLSVIKEELDRQDKNLEAELQVHDQAVEATNAEAQATPEAQGSSREVQSPLDGKQVSQAILGATHADAIVVPVDDPEVVQKYHAIDRIPEIVGCSVGFVRQLSEAGVITLKRSPHGRDLVDGKDLTLIRLCSDLRHFGFEPKNLRQYVMAANRESSMFAKSLVVYAKKGGGVEVDYTDETRQKFMAALTRMLGLTNAIRNELITKLVRESFKDMRLDE